MAEAAIAANDGIADAQRSAFASESAWIEVSSQRQMALAGLFRVLGGGWPAETTP